MKYILQFIICLFSFGSLAQSNDWIDYNKQYLKLEIASEGIYRVKVSEMLSAGMTLDQMSAKKPHLVYHGKEVPLNWIDINGIVDSNDYIEFYANKNLGERDSLLYEPNSVRPNPYYSLFQDEAVYFLNWTEKEVKKWISEERVLANIDFAETQTRKNLQVYNNQYSFNNSIGLLPFVQQSYFENGEGWTGPFLSMDSAATFKYTLADITKESTLQIDFQLNGRSRNSHTVLYEINGIRQEDTLRFAAFGIIKKQITLSNEELNGSQNLVIKFIGIKADEYDWFSLTFMELTYEASLNAEVKNLIFDKNVKFKAKNASDRILEINNRFETVEIIPNADSYNLTKGRNFKVFETTSKASKLTLYKPSLLSKEANYFIITAPSIIEGAKAYETYRSSNAGGMYKVLTVTTQEIYDQFGYGERNPVAIKDFLKVASNGDYNGKHLLLLGRGVSFPDVLKLWKDRDLVPTIGYPGSDVLLSAGLDASKDPSIQSISTGRLNVTKNSEILAYLAKVKEIEAAPVAQEWKKRVAHLSGGKTVQEIESLKFILESVKLVGTDQLLGAQVDTYVKKSTDEVEPIDISKEVNEGYGMITFAGHGSTNVLDLDIGYCSPVANGYENKGKYPVMYFNGCGVGNVFYRYDPLTTDWLLTPDKGAIAVFANSFWSYELSTQLFLNDFYKELFQNRENAGLSLGEVHQKVNQKQSRLKFNPYVLSNIQQLILQGDPAIKFFPLDKVDFEISSESIFIQGENSNFSLEKNENLRIGVIVKNNGRFEAGTSNNLTINYTSAGTSKEVVIPMTAFARVDTFYTTIPNVAISKITAESNKEKNDVESRFDNNYNELTIANWQEASLANSWPLNVVKDKFGPTLLTFFDDKLIVDSVVVASNAKIKIYLYDGFPLAEDVNAIQVSIKKCESCEFEIVPVSILGRDNDYNLIFGVNESFKPGIYTISVSGVDAAGNKSNGTFLRTFEVLEARLDSKLSISPNPGSEFAKLVIDVKANINPLESRVRIVSVSGVPIYDQNHSLTVGVNEIIIPLSSFSSGVYPVKVEINWDGETEVVSQKLLKK